MADKSLYCHAVSGFYLRRALRFTFGFAEIEFTVFLIQKSPIA
jgi:hypothetical protein